MRIKFQITDEHRESGVRADPTSCPVSLAVSDWIKFNLPYDQSKPIEMWATHNSIAAYQADESKIGGYKTIMSGIVPDNIREIMDEYDRMGTISNAILEMDFEISRPN